ncbi:MAG TPA: S-layer homology domain-containing protein, partial [Clostridia bacterium]
MKKIKKHTSGIIVLTILIAMLIPVQGLGSSNPDANPVNLPVSPGLAYADKLSNALPFSDVKADDWFIDDLKYILNYGKGIFSGYPDGTFRPADTLTMDMYIKLIVTAMGHNIQNGKEYWASTYIK